MRRIITLLSLIISVLLANSAFAAQLKIYVTEINAVGIQNRDEMKQTLQVLLSSRLSNDKIIVVNNQAEADVVVSGTYIAIGKVYSVDAMARTVSGKTIARAYVQGDTGEELIPSIGKLAEKLSVELNKNIENNVSFNKTLPVAESNPVAQTDIVKTKQSAANTDIIKNKELEQVSAGSWVSKRLEGAYNLIAIGKTFDDGSREVFMAEERRIAYYHQSGAMKLISSVDLRSTEKIISLDTIEESDQITYLYVTIIRGDEPASQVWQVKNNMMLKVADKLPWMFRSMILPGERKKLYAQSMGRDADFYGDVYEVERAGSMIKTKKALKMPRFGNLYTFNQFKDTEGSLYFVVINADGYLLVYDNAQKELWRSNEKFGGSELFFQKEDLVNILQNGGKDRWVYMDQRILVTSRGDVLIGKNEGFWVLGNARSYKKGAVFCFHWNGSSLEEKWRTRDTQNYMPDYYLDESRNELLILQTVQRAGLSTRGASSLAIKKIE